MTVKVELNKSINFFPIRQNLQGIDNLYKNMYRCQEGLGYFLLQAYISIAKEELMRYIY
jgi:hypothetical protein